MAYTTLAQIVANIMSYSLVIAF